MLLAYLDETYDDATHYMSALMVKDVDAIPLSTALDEVVEYAQDNYGRIRSDAELHAYELAWGRGDWQTFRGRPDASADIYTRAIAAIADTDVTIACRGVTMPGLRRRYGDGADGHAVSLTFVLERIQTAAARQRTVALAIADEVGAKQARYRANLRQYQQMGTWGYKSAVLDRIVDTLHFTPSSSSRLLQAADLVSYTRYEKDRTDNHPRAREFYNERWEELRPRVQEDSCWYA